MVVQCRDPPVRGKLVRQTNGSEKEDAMPMITVEYPQGTLSQEQKDALAEEMTHVLLEIEGGADTPDGRSIAWVRFREIAETDWYIGGTTDGKYVSAAGKFLI